MIESTSDDKILLSIARKLDQEWLSARTHEERMEIGAKCDQAWYKYSQSKWKADKK